MSVLAFTNRRLVRLTVILILVPFLFLTAFSQARCYSRTSPVWFGD